MNKPDVVEKLADKAVVALAEFFRRCPIDKRGYLAVKVAELAFEYVPSENLTLSLAEFEQRVTQRVNA